MSRHEAYDINDLDTLQDTISELCSEAGWRRVMDNKYIAQRLDVPVEELNGAIDFLDKVHESLDIVMRAVDITHEKEYRDLFIG